VGGDSAGGNLAAAAALLARGRNGPAIAHQLLLYPALDSAMDSDSYTEFAKGYYLTRDVMALKRGSWGMTGNRDRSIFFPFCRMKDVVSTRSSAKSQLK